MAMGRDGYIIFGTVTAVAIGTLVLDQYNKNREHKLNEEKVKNQKAYIEKLTPEQVERLETEKLTLKGKEIELKKAEADKRQCEAELKKTVTDFKKDIQSEIQRTTNQNIERDMRRTFDTWAGKYEDRIDKKLDRMTTRIDDLSDKYGGVKSTGTPSINVVNAPNN